MILISVGLASLVLLYCIVRIYWMIKNINSYILVMASYAKLNNISDNDIIKKSELVSLWHILLEFNHWEFYRYIIHQQDYHNACAFHVELMFKTLGLDKNGEKHIEE